MNTRLHTLILIFALLLSIFTNNVFASQVSGDEKVADKVPEFRLSSSSLFLGLVLIMVTYIDIRRKIPLSFAVLHKIEILASFVLSTIAFHYLCKYNIIDCERGESSYLLFFTVLSLILVFYSAFCAFINMPIFKFASPWAMWRWKVSEERKNKPRGL